MVIDKIILSKTDGCNSFRLWIDDVETVITITTPGALTGKFRLSNGITGTVTASTRWPNGSYWYATAFTARVGWLSYDLYIKDEGINTLTIDFDSEINVTKFSYNSFADSRTSYGSRNGVATVYLNDIALYDTPVSCPTPNDFPEIILASVSSYYLILNGEYNTISEEGVVTPVVGEITEEGGFTLDVLTSDIIQNVILETSALLMDFNGITNKVANINTDYLMFITPSIQILMTTSVLSIKSQFLNEIVRMLISIDDVWYTLIDDVLTLAEITNIAEEGIIIPTGLVTTNFNLGDINTLSNVRLAVHIKDKVVNTQFYYMDLSNPLIVKKRYISGASRANINTIGGRTNTGSLYYTVLGL